MKLLTNLLCCLIFNIGISQEIILDANNSFFSPKGTLKLYGEYAVIDDFNRNKHYERIGSWRNKTDTIVWGLKNLKTGTLDVELFSSISENENNSEVSIFIDDVEKSLAVKSTNHMQDYISQGSLSFNINSKETHELKLLIKSQNTTEDFGEVQKIVLSGSATENANVWIRRWRPAAIHGKFFTDDDTETEISVYEISLLNPELDSYQVMTTEFGYIGSPNAIGEGFTGLNFSLWSYDANDPTPPHDELSHLVAVGGITNRFGRYGHEGTGVKPRNFNPYNNYPGRTFSIALRKVPGEKYNTYWCYYLDYMDYRWKLYGCGKKLNSSSNLEHLKITGGFLEIVGPQNNSRTGHKKRAIEYRGWRMKSNGNWLPINKLEPAYVTTDLSYKNWRTNSFSDRFIFEAGGFADTGDNPGTIVLNDASPLPFYLENNYLEDLFKMPAIFTTLNKEANNTEAIITYEIESLGTDPEIKLYYGREYGLTEGITQDYLIDTKWEYEIPVSIENLNDNRLSVNLTNLNPNTTYYYRLRIKNNKGITWSMDTENFTTSESLNTNSAIKKRQYYLSGNKLIFSNKSSKEIVIHSINGSKIFTTSLTKNELDLNYLRKGMYFLTVKNKDSIERSKFIKK